jgi:hypothetical protein
MENIMKKILTLLLILPSLMSYADGVNLNPVSSMSSVVVQKALASGVTFTTNQVQYQLILGGRAIMKSNNSVAALSANSSSNNLWADDHGPYLISIGTGGQSVNNSLSANGVNFKQIAYNPDSGKVAIIVGDIVVKIRPSYSAEAIAATYNINLVENFKDISYAWYQVKAGQDIFAIAQNISGHPGVESAEIEIIEDYREPR